MNSATTSLPLRRGAPGLAPAPAARQLWLARAGQAVWGALQAAGRARAQRELLDFAARCEAQQPELARELRAAASHGPLL